MLGVGGQQRSQNPDLRYRIPLVSKGTVPLKVSNGDVTIASVYLQIQTVSLAQTTYLLDTMFVLSVSPTAEHKPESNL